MPQFETAYFASVHGAHVREELGDLALKLKVVRQSFLRRRIDRKLPPVIRTSIPGVAR